MSTDPAAIYGGYTPVASAPPDADPAAQYGGYTPVVSAAPTVDPATAYGGYTPSLSLVASPYRGVKGMRSVPNDTSKVQIQAEETPAAPRSPFVVNPRVQRVQTVLPGALPTVPAKGVTQVTGQNFEPSKDEQEIHDILTQPIVKTVTGKSLGEHYQDAVDALRKNLPATLTLPNGTPIAADPAFRVAAAIGSTVPGLADFMYSPLGIATLATGGASAITQRLVSAGFSLDMAHSLGEQAAEAVRNPTIENVTGVATTAAMAYAAGAHAASPHPGVDASKPLTDEQAARASAEPTLRVTPQGEGSASFQAIQDAQNLAAAREQHAPIANAYADQRSALLQERAQQAEATPAMEDPAAAYGGYTPETATPVETPATPVETPATPVETPATPVETPATPVETPATPVAAPIVAENATVQPKAAPRGWSAIEPPVFTPHPSTRLTDAELIDRQGNPPLPPPRGTPQSVSNAWDVVSQIVPELASRVTKITANLPENAQESAVVNPATGEIRVKPKTITTPETLWHELIHLDQPDAQNGRAALSPHDFNTLEIQARSGISDSLRRFNDFKPAPPTKGGTPSAADQGQQPGLEVIQPSQEGAAAKGQPSEAPAPTPATSGPVAPNPGVLDRMVDAGKKSDDWLHDRGILGGGQLSANAILDPQTIYHLARSVAGDVARGVITLRDAAQQILDHLREKFGDEAKGVAVEDIERHIQTAMQEPEASTVSEREPQPETPKTPVKPGQEAPPREQRLTASPSYDETRSNAVKFVSPEYRAEFEKSLDTFEKRNPEREVVGFDAIREQARAIDPRIVADIDVSKLKPGEYLPAAVVHALRETVNGIGDEIAKRSQALTDGEATMTPDALAAARKDLNALVAEQGRMMDALIPLRSQAGRDLRYWAMESKATFDSQFWMNEARRVSGHDGLSEQDSIDLQRILGEARAAKDKLDSLTKKLGITPEEIEQAKGRLKNFGEEARDLSKQIAETARKLDAIKEFGDVRADQKDDLTAQLADAKKQLADNIKQYGKDSAKVTDLRDQIKETSARLDAIREFGDVRAADRADLEKQLADAKAALKTRNRQYIQDSMAVKRLQQKIDEASGNGVDLTAAQSEMRAKRVALTTKLQEIQRSSIPETLLGIMRSFLLGLRTLEHIIVSHTTHPLSEEAARIPGSVFDLAMSAVTGRRTLQGFSPRGLWAGQKALIGKGLPEAYEMLKTGTTEEMRAQFEVGHQINPVELNSGHAYLRPLEVAFNKTLKGLATVAEWNLRTHSATYHAATVANYQRALYEQMKLAKLDYYKDAPTAQMAAEAMHYALYEAMREDTLFGRVVTGGRRGIQNLSVAAAKKAPGGVAGGAGKFIMGSAKAFDYGVQFVIPFSRIPAAVAEIMFNYTPVGSGSYVLAHSIRAMVDKEFTPFTQRAIAQNLGRMTVGSALILAGWKLAAAGRLTGTSPTDKGEKGVLEKARIPPMSIRVGDTWYAINRIGPEIGMLPIVGANLYEAYGHVKKGEAQPETFGQKAMKFGAASALETGKVIMDQPFLKSVRDLTGAIDNPVGRGGRLVSSFAGRSVPTAISDVAAEGDKYRRLSSGGTFGENVAAGVKSRIPGLRETLPVRRDIFGQPVAERTGSVYNFMFPQKGSADPIDQELVRVKASIAEPGRQNGEDPKVFDLRSQLVGKYMERQVTRAMESARYENAESDDIKRKIIEQATATAHRIASERTSTNRFRALSVQEKVDTLQDWLDR